MNEKAVIPAITKGGWDLVESKTGVPVFEKSVHTDFRGDKLIVVGGSPPHNSSSTGRIETNKGFFYPGICDLEWRLRELPSATDPHQ